MIKEIERETFGGNIGCSLVSHNSKYFYISTVNLPRCRIGNVMAEWRDDWWPPPYPNETMVWKSNENCETIGSAIHCQGYRKSSSALKSHKKLCRQAEAKGIKAFNGRSHQTEKLEKDQTPTGLIKEIARRTRGIND